MAGTSPAMTVAEMRKARRECCDPLIAPPPALRVIGRAAGPQVGYSDYPNQPPKRPNNPQRDEILTKPA
jgi:hypothetical protein